MVKIKYIFIALAVIAVIGFFWWLSRRKNISFDFNMGGDLSNILSSVQGRYAQRSTDKGIGVYVDVPLTTIITNKGAGKTILESIMGSISYNGEAILQTKANSPTLQRVEVEGKSIKQITDTVQVLVNPASIKFLTQLVQGKKPLVKYNFSTVIFGKPQAFTNQTEINK